MCIPQQLLTYTLGYDFTTPAAATLDQPDETFLVTPPNPLANRVAPRNPIFAASPRPALPAVTYADFRGE